MVTAHSGSDGTPENSLVFLEEMLDGKAACVEVDVRRAESNVLYLSHDAQENIDGLVTLEEAFERMAWDEECWINCDLKEGHLEQPVFDLAKKYGIWDRLILSGSVYISQLRTVRERGKVFYNPENLIPNMSSTFTKRNLDELLAFCKKNAIQTLNVNHHFAEEWVIDHCRQEGIGLSVWTVNDLNRIDWFKSQGVRNVTTRRAKVYQEREQMKEEVRNA